MEEVMVAVTVAVIVPVTEAAVIVAVLVQGTGAVIADAREAATLEDVPEAEASVQVEYRRNSGLGGKDCGPKTDGRVERTDDLRQTLT